MQPAAAPPAAPMNRKRDPGHAPAHELNQPTGKQDKHQVGGRSAPQRQPPRAQARTRRPNAHGSRGRAESSAPSSPRAASTATAATAAPAPAPAPRTHTGGAWER